MALYLVGDAQTYSAKWDVTFNVDVAFTNRFQGNRDGSTDWTVQVNRASALAYGGTGPLSFELWAGEKTGTFISNRYDLAGAISINNNRSNGRVEVRLYYRLTDNRFGSTSSLNFKPGLSGYFVLETLPFPQRDLTLGRIPIQEYRVTGTVKAKIMLASPYLEYVDINEHYPLEGPFEYDNCGSEFYIPADLTEETVRQWPKYTTVDWFELLDTRKTATCSVSINAEFIGKKGTKTFGASNTYPAWPPNIDTTKTKLEFRPTYQVGRVIEAHASGDSSANGSIYVSYAGTELSGGQNKSVSIPGVSCDTFSYSITGSGLQNQNDFAGQARFAKIDMQTRPTRTVTWHSQIKDWKDNHSKEATVYLAGFNSNGKTFADDPSQIKCSDTQDANNLKLEAIPTYETVNTNDGNVSSSQKYSYHDGTIEVQDLSITNPASKSDFVRFNNFQKWIFGMIDGTTYGEYLDDLISPTKNEEYPAKYAKIFGACGKDVNCFPRSLVLDENDLPSGSSSVPIALRGWKFNALDISQNETYPITGSGNVRIYEGTDDNPNRYGDLNFSGYRYLDFDLKSKTSAAQNFKFSITETSKGPVSSASGRQDFPNNSGFFDDIKSWDLSISNQSSTFTIDLCNPDNKTDNVDNQDSPYPRLNVYSTSKSSKSSVFGYLAQENQPKDTKLITKKTITSSGLWIDDQIKNQIALASTIYIYDSVSGIVDYFDVDVQKFDNNLTDTIYGKSRLRNGLVKFSRTWSGSEAVNDEDTDYRKSIFVKITKNDLTKNKKIDQLLDFKTEIKIIDYDEGYPDETEKVASLTNKFTDGDLFIDVTPISFYENPEIKNPYTHVILEISPTSRKKYQVSRYEKDQTVTPNTVRLYITPSIPGNRNIVFNVNNTSVKLAFQDGYTDDAVRTLIIKVNETNPYIKLNSYEYKLNIDYAKRDLSSEPDYNGIPRLELNKNQYITFSVDSALVNTNSNVYDFVFPINSQLSLTYGASNSSSQSEINAIDDYPDDEVSNGPYYGISRVRKIDIDNENLELGTITLRRKNSKSNFIIAGDKNSFEQKTKFIVAKNENSENGPTITTYYTRRFWQQNTDGRDEEEGDITWQKTPITTAFGRKDNWTLYPKSISDLCDDINAIDTYVISKEVNNGVNNFGDVVRHTGWKATKSIKSYPTDPYTGARIYTNKLDPEYLNTDTGLATWIYGGGLLCLPDQNGPSGTSFNYGFDLDFNANRKLIAQTIFHRINGNFPPGRPDLFGNSAIKVSDEPKQKSVLHLRGGTISRGPGHGLILPPKLSTPEDLRKANLIRSSDNFNAGSDETDSIGYYETTSEYGNNNINHFVKLEPTEKISNSDRNKSSDRKIAQAKRERASFKPGIEKQVAVTSVSVVETGFENSLLFAYNVPSKTPYETVVISTDSFYDPFYEKNPIGFDVLSGTGQTIKGVYPYLLSSEIIKNKDTHPHSFVITEFDTAEKYDKSSSFKSNIGANLNFRDKNTWYPLRSGNVDPKLNFNQYTTIFEKTKFNGYCLSDYSPQIYCVGYADPGSIVLQTTHLALSNVNSPNTDQVLHIDGKVPTDVAQFRLFEPITTVGTATTAFASVIQMKSREIMVAYSLEEEPRKIYYKIVSNNQVQAKNLLLDLDDLAGNTLNASYNIYGINSVYDRLANIHKTTFWSNGNVYYHEFDIDGSKTGNQKTSILHLVKGDANDKLASALSNKKLLKKYFDTASGFATTIPAQRPGITSCQKQSYASHTIIAYQTGKCKIEAILFKPFAETFLSSREFEIECPNETPGDTTGGGTGGDTGGGTGGGDTGGDTTGGGGGGDTTGGGGGGNNNTSKPNAKFTADPVSGTKDLSVTFTNLSTPFNDTTPISKFKWDFYGDGTELLETTNLNPVVFVYKNVGTFYPKLIVVDINNIESDVFNTIAITVNDIVNQPPIADFNFEQNTFLPPFLVAFTDTSRDTDGSIISWNWNFGDSNTSILQNPSNQYTIEGTYNVKLIVTDNLGKTGEIVKSVTISRLPNKPPVPDFTYTQKSNTYTADFINNSTDPENDSLVYDWILNEFDANSKSNLKDPSYTYQVSGIYNVTLKATDTNLNTASVTKQVQINDVVNLAPRILDLSYSQTSFTPLTIKFTENSTDDDGYIEQWIWNFGDTNQEIITDNTLKNVSHIYSSPGRYVVSLTVSDNGLPVGINKKTATGNMIVIVAPPPSNIPPVASFLVDNNNLPAIFTSTFTDQSTDADGKIVSWSWDLPNNQQILFDTTNYQKTVSYTFTKSGVYTIKLTVTDDKGSSNTTTLDINVINQNPSALLSVSPNPVLSRNNVLFDASRSNDIDGNITSYSWDFGNGFRKSFGSNTENYIYNLPGTYTASVTVTDNLGAQNSAFVDVVVQNRSPFARITFDLLTVKAPNSLNFSGTSSYDEDGTILGYSWSIVNKTSNAIYFTSSSSVISVPFTTEGFYRVTLTVTDNLGATNSASVDVTVTPADNIPPIAALNVDKNSGKANDVFNFNFRGSYDPDANGSIIRYIINFGDNAEEVYTYAPFFVGHRYTSPGTCVAKLTVIDNRFGRSIETPQSVQTITITNQAPVANFSVAPTAVLTYEDVFLTDLSTDLENSIVKWTWNFGDGSPDLIIVDPLLVNQTKQYIKGNRDYIITLTVEDNFGLSNSISKTVTVINRKPIALIKTDPLAINNLVTVEQNTTIVFTSDSYDIDGSVVAYEWYIVGITAAPITTKNFYRAFVARDALYEVTLRVMDDQNLWSDTVSVFVKVQAPNTPPVVYLNANPPSGTASAPVTVFFDSNGTFDPDNPNELLTYFWDFGNGSFSSSPSASTTYSKAGSYNVYLDVTDRRGSTTNRVIIYVVNEATTGDTTTDGTTTGPIVNGDTTTGGNNTGSNVNSAPIAPPTTTSTTTTVNNGTTNTTTNGATTNWFSNPANQVTPDTGPTVDPNIQGAS
jgi:PKD repeat protein